MREEEKEEGEKSEGEKRRREEKREAKKRRGREEEKRERREEEKKKRRREEKTRREEGRGEEKERREEKRRGREEIPSSLGWPVLTVTATAAMGEIGSDSTLTQTPMQSLASALTVRKGNPVGQPRRIGKGVDQEKRAEPLKVLPNPKGSHVQQVLLERAKRAKEKITKPRW